MLGPENFLQRPAAQAGAAYAQKQHMFETLEKGHERLQGQGQFARIIQGKHGQTAGGQALFKVFGNGAHIAHYGRHFGHSSVTGVGPDQAALFGHGLPPAVMSFSRLC